MRERMDEDAAPGQAAADPPTPQGSSRPVRPRPIRRLGISPGRKSAGRGGRAGRAGGGAVPIRETAPDRHISANRRLDATLSAGAGVVSTPTAASARVAQVSIIWIRLRPTPPPLEQNMLWRQSLRRSRRGVRFRVGLNVRGGGLDEPPEMAEDAPGGGLDIGLQRREVGHAGRLRQSLAQ